MRTRSTLHTILATAAAVALSAAPAPAQSAPSRPCEDGGPYADFDFWIGEWDVSVPDGRRAGGNRIEKIESGCLLLESWTSAGGGTGTSINYYDPSTERWVQQWVSSDGVLIHIEGRLRGASMVLEGRLVSAPGDSQPFRGTWTPAEDGSVRQHFEISADGGATWATWFDGRYVRRGP